MNIEPECVTCIVNQSRRVGEVLGVDDVAKARICDIANAHAKHFSFSSTPPVNAAPMYEALARLLNRDDLYKEFKQKSTQHALQAYPSLKKSVQSSRDTFFSALKASVAGNVIDLGAEKIFNIDDEIAHIFETPFAIDDSKILQSRLKNAKKVVFLADNAGEHIFDLILLETLKLLYSGVDIFYLVRGSAIINDVTYTEASNAGVEKFAKLIDSGVNTPGFDYNSANENAKALFDSADVVISKGMGNYECLSPTHRGDVFFLLKIKCDVVARSLKRNLGEIICKQNQEL